MTRKKRTRKIWGDPSTAAVRAILGASITTEKELDTVRIGELGAIAAFAGGAAKFDDVCVVIGMINTCEVFARQGVGPEALEACARAEDAVRSTIDRMEQIKCIEMSADGVQALRDVYEYGDLQRQSVSRAEYTRVLKKTIDIMRSMPVREISV